MTTIRRKGVLTGMVTAVLGLVIALPFTIIHPAVPFTVLFLSFGVVWLLCQWRWLPKYPMSYFAGCLAALVILLPSVSLIKFMEQGFDSGPFYGVAYERGVTGLEASDRIEYRRGELVIYNRQPSNPPVVTYQIGDDVQWGRELDVTQHSEYQDFHLSAITNLSLAYGIVRDHIDFQGIWTPGTEQGRAYLWKWGGFHRFYLSW